MRGLCLNRLTNGPYVHFASGVRSRLGYFSIARLLCQHKNSIFSKNLPHSGRAGVEQAQRQPQIYADHRIVLVKFHLLALRQAGQCTLVYAPQLFQPGVVVRVHQGAVLGQLHGTALFQHLADELGAEIVPAALPADMHPAERKTDNVDHYNNVIQITVGYKFAL